MEHFDIAEQTLAERYQVHEKLGEGAMGSVYRAEDLQLQREVALKVLHRDWVAKEEVKKRLEHECRLMARLGPHANIVTLFDRMEYKGNVILVMEYVPGETLEDVIERTRSQRASDSTKKTTPLGGGGEAAGGDIVLSQQDAVAVISQCLNGLDFAHGKGVLHRDIKPSNILIMRDHHGGIIAKIMDFGIGKAVQGAEDDSVGFTSLTRVGGPGPGTPAYMAPEQIDPERFGTVGPQADLYALGITLYEALTLRLPFEGTYTELLNSHTNVAPPNPQDLGVQVPPELANVLQGALAKTLDERYASAEEFQADLSAVTVSGTGTMVTGGGRYRPPRPTLQAQSRRAGLPLAKIAGVGAAVLAIMLIGIGVYPWPNGGEDSPTNGPVNPNNTLVAPHVEGLGQVAAESAIENAGLRVGSVTQEGSSSVNAGNVIRQNPSPGTTAEDDDSVDLVIAREGEPPAVDTPNLTGMAQWQAESAIENAGLRVGSVTEEESSSVNAGNVIRQNPSEGTTVDEGSSVNIVVSSERPRSTVPDVTGMRRTDAEGRLANVDLRLGSVRTEESGSVSEGRIIRHSPSSGTRVDEGSAVDIVIATPPPPVREYTLRYSAGSGGSIQGNTSQTVEEGSNGAQVRAAPNQGYNFVRWSDGSTQNPRTDTGVTQNLEVTAEFIRPPRPEYTLRYSAGSGGSIQGTTSQTVEEGANGTTVTARPDNEEIDFIRWSDGSTQNPRTDTGVTGNINVEAEFEYKDTW